MHRRQLVTLLVLSLASLFMPLGARVQAQLSAGVTLDESAGPGANYDKADFRLWLPADAGPVRAIVVMVPGLNGDGRPEVNDAAWQAFATRLHLALVGCRFTDKPHAQSFIEEYVDVSHGTGQVLLDTIGVFAGRAKHPELATAPFLLWGMSAGGQFNYEFTAWKPERVAAFVVNKGGIYYTALTPKAARDVPGMLFIGGKDLESRVDIITGLFAVNRRGGALWALAEEPAAAHIVGRSKDLSLIFFEEILPLRLGDPAAGGALKPLAEKSGFIGDIKAKTFQAASAAGTSTTSTAWLPTERVARAWRAMVTETPFER